jgi:propanol-preferring alcohol dehydrogenase
MKAFRFNEANSGLQLSDVARPVPGPSEVLIQVKGAGLCHSDCIIMKDSSYGLIAQRPLTLGHEVAGVIAELGPDVSEYALGERVACCLIGHPAAEADWANAIGLGYDGGYAEFAIVRAASVVRIPESVSFAQAAVATDSVATAYHAVVAEGRVGPSQVVAVVGLGGLGLSGVRIAALKGASVYGIDLDTGKFAQAKELGATRCASSLEEFKGVSFDVVIDFAGAGVTTAAAAKAVKDGGKVVLVGLAANRTTLDTHDLVLRCITVSGSLGASRAELEDVLRLIAAKEITPLTTEIPFTDVPKGLADLEEGKVNGRLFTDPSKANTDGLS